MTKLSACKNPVTEPGDWATYVVGKENTFSLPANYGMKGFLIEPVTVGGIIRLLRIERNGVAADGVFTSTLIMKIRQDSLVETFNSIYRVVPANPHEKEPPAGKDLPRDDVETSVVPSTEVQHESNRKI